MLLFAAVGLTLKWCLNELIPATQAVNAGHITFAVVNGVMLPALAWCVNRALRYQWATANLSAISAAMQAWSARLQKMQAPF
jgi:xanthine/uracil/vitamin C permease (AzgA family)